MKKVFAFGTEESRESVAFSSVQLHGLCLLLDDHRDPHMCLIASRFADTSDCDSARRVVCSRFLKSPSDDFVMAVPSIQK